MKFAPIPLFLALAWVLAGCQPEQVASFRDHPPQDDVSNLHVAGYDMGEPIQVENLTVVPLMDKDRQYKDASPLVDYLTLDEATQRGIIDIRELDNPTVELLKVKNTGTQPILLVGGDLLLGGQQDRVVQQDTIVHPGSTIAVKVFCVEHGRWSGDPKFKYQAMKAPTRVRKAAILEGEQQQVWSRVGELNSSLGSAGESTSVRAGFAAASGAANSKVERILQELRKQSDVVGVVFAVNGKVQTMDVYGTPRLFQASSEGLLRGFVTDAMAAPALNREVARKSDVAELVNRYSRLRSKVTETNGVAKMAEGNYRGVELKAPGQAAAAPAAHGMMSID